MSDKYTDRMKDYVDVAARIQEFAAKHPAGSLQPVNPVKPIEVVTIGDKTYLQYVAAAFRSPEDTRPGIGVAWELYPGTTPYTRDSEAMNAETSAWGRAIVAVLAADTHKGIASADEVRAAQERQADKPAPTPRTDAPTPGTPSAADIAASCAEGMPVETVGTVDTEPEAHEVKGKGANYTTARFTLRTQEHGTLFVTAWHAAADYALANVHVGDEARVSGKWHHYRDTLSINADNVYVDSPLPF